MATTPKCVSSLKSFNYCQGTAVVPGIKKRVYIAATSAIKTWPTLALDSHGRPTGAEYTGAFALEEGAKFIKIDHLPNKAEFKGETQGEEPSQTFKVNVSVFHPGVGVEAANAAAVLNGQRVVALVEDAQGYFRVVGCEMYDGAKVTISRDNGQGATGTAGTTIAFEADDIVDAPFYTGAIVTEEGTVQPKLTAVHGSTLPS